MVIFEKRQYTLNVTSEGSIVIPTIGIVYVNDLTLSEAKAKIRKKINEVYTTSQFSITLERLRSFKTYVNGEVKKKGSVVVDGNTRISDIIVVAGGITEQGKKRGIEIYNDVTKTTKIVDLVLAENASDFSKNPYICDGDRVYVPSRKEAVQVNGKVAHSGRYDFIEGDNVATLISLAGGFSRGADTNNILVYQYDSNTDSVICTEISKDAAGSFTLKAGDRIVVLTRKDFQENYQVYLNGQVFSPGEYPIIKGKTRLSEIIESAGGLKPTADLAAARIVRKEHQYPGDFKFKKIKRIPSKVQYPEEQRYFLTKSTENETRVSIDLKKYAKDTEYDVLLENGDEIVIPEKTTLVKIIGAVVRPGLILHAENKEVAYYVEKSGGFIKNAKKGSIRIIKAGTENLLDTENEIVEPGDVIWVPEKQYVDRVQVTKDWVLFISAVATTVLTFFALKDQIN